MSAGELLDLSSWQARLSMWQMSIKSHDVILVLIRELQPHAFSPLTTQETLFYLKPPRFTWTLYHPVASIGV